MQKAELQLRSRGEDETSCPKEGETSGAGAAMPGRGLDPLRHVEKTLSYLLSCLQAVQYAPSPLLCELSPILGWASVMQLPLSHFCFCK
jgi:hypothetical protein